MEREVNLTEKITQEDKLRRIHDTFSKFPPTAIDVDIEGKMTAAKFSYTFSPAESTSGFVDFISGTRLFDGSLTIYYGKGSLGGRITIRKNETGETDLLRSVVYERFPKVKNKANGNAMTPAVKKNGKGFKPDLHTIDSLLVKTEAKMAQDPHLFKHRLTQDEEAKVMKWSRAMIKAMLKRDDQLRREKEEKLKLKAKLSKSKPRRKLS